MQGIERDSSEETIDTFNKNVSKSRIKGGQDKILSQSRNESNVTWPAARMVIYNKMIVVFERSACRTKRTFKRVATMKSLASGKKKINPFEIEYNSMGVVCRQAVKDRPVNVRRVGPLPRCEDVLFEGMSICNLTDSTGKMRCNSLIGYMELTDAILKSGGTWR